METEPGVWHWVWLTAQDELVCFPAWTTVATEFGVMPIQRVMSGMRVWTRNGLRVVSATSKRKYSGGMVTVRADGARVTSTADHLYWTLEHGWLEGRQLNRGHTLETVGKKAVKVLAILNFSLGDTDNVPAVIRKVRGFASIPDFILMPIRAINFECNTERCQKKINAISSHLGFLDVFKMHSAKALADCLFKGGLALKRAITSKATKLTIGVSWADSELLAAIAAVDIYGRASTLLGAIMSVKMLLRPKHFAASFTGDIFGISRSAFNATSGITIRDRLGNLKAFATHGTYLGNKNGLSVGVVASPRAEAFTAFNSGGRSMKVLATVFAGERLANACSEMITFCRAVLGFVPLTYKRLVAAGTDFVIRHICHLRSDMVILYHRLSGTANYVYDITVEDDPEFYANGILVHNCPQCGPLHNTSVGIAKILPQEQEPVAGGVTPMTPGALVAKPPTPDEVLRGWEAEIIKAHDYERAIVVDDAGNVLFDKKGGKSTVEFTPRELSKLKGATLTHNHPKGSSFSVEDSRMLFDNELSEIRAVGWQWDTSYLYRMHPDAEIRRQATLYKSSWMDNLQGVDKTVRSEFRELIRNGTLSIDDAANQHWHEVWTRFEKLYKDKGILGYTREVIP